MEIAELFATTKQNVSLHARNILEEGELGQEATVKESLTVQTGGELALDSVVKESLTTAEDLKALEELDGIEKQAKGKDRR